MKVRALLERAAAARSILVAGSAVVAACVLGLVAQPAQANERLIREALPKAFPSITKIDEVSPSPVPGLWSVRIGGQLVYTTADAAILVEGQMVNIKTKENLTKAALDKALAVDFDVLPLSDSLVTHKHGTGARRIAVFADPTCGFCKRYEPTLHQLENVTVHTFVLAMLGPQAADMAKRVMCANDPVQAWNAWMIKGERPADPSADCDSSVLERNKQLAAKLGVSGTPTTLLTDRSRLSGAVAPEDLRNALSKLRPATESAQKPGAAKPAVPKG